MTFEFLLKICIYNFDNRLKFTPATITNNWATSNNFTFNLNVSYTTETQYTTWMCNVNCCTFYFNSVGKKLHQIFLSQNLFFVHIRSFHWRSFYTSILSVIAIYFSSPISLYAFFVSPDQLVSFLGCMFVKLFNKKTGDII